MELGVHHGLPFGGQPKAFPGGLGGVASQAAPSGYGHGGGFGQGAPVVPPGFGGRTGQALPRTPEEASGQQELIIVGSMNNWSTRAAKQQPLGLRLLPDGIWQHECRVQLNHSGELEFQVLSKASAWEWCLYPEDGDRSTLVAGSPSAVKVGLSVLDGAHDKNFKIVEPGKTVVHIKVRVCVRDFLVWYDKESPLQAQQMGGSMLSSQVHTSANSTSALQGIKQLYEMQMGPSSPQEPTTTTWRVIGGADKGGIAVRIGASFESETLHKRLSTGALIREEERRNERIHYERLSGTGPHRGWVSIRIPGKELLEEVSTCSNPHFVTVAPETKRKSKKKTEVPQPPPPDDNVEWTGGRSAFIRAPPGGPPADGGKQADPTESIFWASLDWVLFGQSQGQYQPTTMAKLRREAPKNSGARRLKEGAHCRVSVVTPTTEGRSEYHERLWACFEAQQWPDKELIVVDTAPEPSAFWRQKADTHEELVYLCMQQNFSIGLKRNMSVHLASGDVIVNFDDDDIYAPNYIEVMVGRLEEQHLAALTLSSWYDYHVRSGRCGFVDPAAMHDVDALMQKDEEGSGKDAKEMKILRDEAVEQAVFGYGFSYVHRRGPALSNPYPDSFFAEDLVFMRQLRWALGRHSVGLLRDEKGICLHMMHGANTANSFSYRTVAPKEFKGLNVFRLKFDFVSPTRGAAGRGGEQVNWGQRARRPRFHDAAKAAAAPGELADAKEEQEEA